MHTNDVGQRQGGAGQDRAGQGRVGRGGAGCKLEMGSLDSPMNWMRRPVVISAGIVGDKNLHETYSTHCTHLMTSMSSSLQAEYAKASESSTPCVCTFAVTDTSTEAVLACEPATLTCH